MNIVYILIKVQMMIYNKEITYLELFSYICFYHIGVCYKGLINIFIKYQNSYLVEALNSLL